MLVIAASYLRLAQHADARLPDRNVASRSCPSWISARTVP
jgi:hypothetical protein